MSQLPPSASSESPAAAVQEQPPVAAENVPAINPEEATVQPSANKPPRPQSKVKERSEVWDHFTKFTDSDGELEGLCNYCPKVYPCYSKKYGTSTLKAHMKACIHNPMNIDASQPQLSVKLRAGESSTVQSWKFDQELCRKKMVAMIVLDELPFKHVEGPGFIDFVEHLQPRFKIPSRWTTSRDINQLFIDEILKLQNYFKTYGTCVSITTDTWTLMQRLNYMCITTHYIDSDWKLHKGDDMARCIDVCLRDWGIARVFVVTVDNAAANQTCLNFLKERLSSCGVDVVGGEHIHMRCTAAVSVSYPFTSS